MNKTLSYSGWKEKSSEHFIVQYSESLDESFVRNTLNEAEALYRRISHQIGFNRYQSYWTWNNRVKIKIFPDPETFQNITGQPEWSKGGAVRHTGSGKPGEIITFQQNAEFHSRMLPHEIGHLIIGDFIGKINSAPLWFEEGVAQLQERHSMDMVQRVMKGFLIADIYIPLSKFNRMDIRREKDIKSVELFYVQSLSLISFLLQKYGTDRFTQLCLYIREGRSFESALKSAYISIFSDMNEFEKKWLNYVQNQA